MFFFEVWFDFFFCCLISTLVIILNCVSLFIRASFISSMLFFYSLNFLEFDSFVLLMFVFFLN